MDASTAIRAYSQPNVGSPLPLARAVSDCALIVLGLCGALICVRRASGALAAGLPGEMLLPCAAFVAIAAFAFRSLQTSAAVARQRTDYLLWASPTVVALLWGAGLSSSATPGGGLLALWSVLALEEAWSWARFLRAARRPSGALPVTARQHAAGRPAVPLTLDIVEELAQADDLGVLQHLVRRRDDDGHLTLEGWARIELAAGQQHANAHVAICPPFAQVAECFVEQSDGPDAQVKVGQSLPYGARFEIKLDRPAKEDAFVKIEFSIQESIAGE